MAALPNLITVAQFRELPEGGEYVYELHHGEVVALTRPKPRHLLLQRQIERLLSQRVGTSAEVVLEWPFRPVPEFDLRAADVAVISRSRFDAMDIDSDFYGAPDLVIEVKSPSNTKRRLRETVALCLVNGSIECWIVDPQHSSITVMRRDGSTEVYTSGQDVPLKAFGTDDSLPVAAIFEGLAVNE